jgi:hypothetical protein
MTTIEGALFVDNLIHNVVFIAASNESLVIEVQPREGSWDRIQAEFVSPIMLSVDSSYVEPEEAELPWEIIGFDSQRLSNEQWSFCLHTEGGEWTFESTWPAIRRLNM